MRAHRSWTMIAFVGFSCWSARFSEAAPPHKPRTLTRLFWQDDDAKELKTANLIDAEVPTLGPAATVAGFPQLDASRQTLVQMESAEGLVLVGVRDDDDGTFQSGWVLVDSGVESDEHGDHIHWDYPKPARVRSSVLDDQQGNPAHLYCYDNSFFIANDKLNGFTWLDACSIHPNDDAMAIRGKALFHQGGGGHITLAAVDRKVVYATWAGRDGENKGRIDVTALSPQGNRQLIQSFNLPHGGLHGATACAGRVFFAPSDGICWIEASSSSVAPEIHQISLGKEGDRPRRTGAFTTFGKHVAFVSGTGESATLYSLDASQPVPQVTEVALKFAQENRPSGLEIVKPRKGSPLAFVFHDHAAEIDAPYRLSIVALDPNEDGRWQDAKVVQVLETGKAKVEGHGGHHCVVFDADRRYAIFSNPGDGTLSVLNLSDQKIVAQATVGGTPSKLVAIGGRDSGH